MTNIIQFSNIQTTLPLFSYQEIIQDVKDQYIHSEIGKIDASIPWDKLRALNKPIRNRKGPLPQIPFEGQIAIMILKSYTNLSDKKLAEQINNNVQFRMFCRSMPSLKPLIPNYKYISRIRTQLSEQINWDEFEKILYDNWSPYIKNKNQILIDATCYETDIRYPTDVKLLWETLEYIVKKLKNICKTTQTKQPRSKYKEIKQEYIKYSRLRKKGYRRSKKMIKKLLYLNKKLLLELSHLQEQHGIAKREKEYLIRKVIHQQSEKLNGVKIKSPILSLSKSYIRPIVRGKETKRVEFGAKVNKIQIDGINFVEHISFEAFHEGIRYEQSIKKAEHLTGEKVQLTGADAIYATNSNRSYAKRRSIFTDFTRKGRAGKNEKSRKLASSIIRKERGSRLEGSFGVEKQNYGLNRVKARTEKNEVLMIYIGIHTKNMLEIGRRIYKSSQASLSPSFKESA